jgi:hypothetical protein
MLAPVDVSALPAPAQRLLSAAAPVAARMMAARGVVPGLKPAEIVTLIAVLCSDADAKVCEVARATLGALPSPILSGALTAHLPALVIDGLVRQNSASHEVLESVLRMPHLAGETLEFMAEHADERAGELIATNEARLLKTSAVIEKLYMNKRVRMSTADRLLELAVRNGLELRIPAFKEAAAAIQNELVAEPGAERSFDDELFDATDQVARTTTLNPADEDTHAVDDEGEEQVIDKFRPLHAQIAKMTVTQKIRRAMLGTAAERLLLVRDNNRLVAIAAAKSPLMREDEAARISASRAVSEDVLRILARNREFTRNYQIKLNLITNPRTPFTFSARLIPHLRESDLNSIAKSKNVPSAIIQAVQQQLSRKRGGAARPTRR